MTTIRDVARAAGVSVATVSRVINDKNVVEEATARRVREAIRVLDYVPHGGARSLTTRRTQVVGVVLPETYGDFFSEVIRGIERVARRAGYHVLVSGSHSDAREAEGVLRTLHGRVDGLILMMPGTDGARFFDRLPRTTPVMLLSDAGERDDHRSLRVDNHGGARLAVEHLIGLGHRRIALIQGPETNADALERRRGYRTALTAAGLPLVPQLELPGDFREESGFRSGWALLSLRPRPTAVFAANDAMAMGCLAALRESGCEVPEGISLVGFDDVPMARYLTPALTTVHVPIAELGQRAMSRLLAEIDGRADPGPRHLVIAPSLTIRNSTAVPPPRVRGPIPRGERRDGSEA